jgi:hypothetical protein
MNISMHQACVSTITRALTNLIAVLEKGAAHAEAKKIDQSVLLQFRLYPDMFPLVKQVQVVSDIAKGGSARLAQVEAPKFEDTEATFADCVERLKKTIAFVESLKPAQIDGSEGRTINWTTGTGKQRSMEGTRYLLTHVMPNVFFHCATAYNILRHNGVELGKLDFLGRPKE